MHLDNSACNLASINLLKYLKEDDTFDIKAFVHTIELIFTAQEILVGYSEYPTESIGKTARAYRELGIGYANLGALLMARGLPYDSAEGRAIAAAITAILTGQSYATSARIAGRVGPFAGFHKDRDNMLNVLRMHRAEVSKIDASLVSEDLLNAATTAWDDAVELGELPGVRNSSSQRPGHIRYDWSDDGLRHDGHRTRPGTRQSQEASRRRDNEYRQPNGAARPQELGIHQGSNR